MSKTVEQPATSLKGRARRMSPLEREEAILDGAISFFAEVGFEGQTRELAERLGITQPLIYRYFPTKDDLIERIYQRLYVSRWQPEWETQLRDRARPLRDRLIETYLIYAKVVLTNEWVRLFLFSALRGNIFNKRYIDFLREKLIGPICEEIEAAGLAAHVSSAHLEEIVWGLHGSVFYLGIRKWVYEVATEDSQTVVPHLVGAFVDSLLAPSLPHVDAPP